MHFIPDLTKLQNLADEIYNSADGGVGCCLHIVLEDQNLHSSSIVHCLERAQKSGHPKCLELAVLLLMSPLTYRLLASPYYRELDLEGANKWIEDELELGLDEDREAP